MFRGTTKQPAPRTAQKGPFQLAIALAVLSLITALTATAAPVATAAPPPVEPVYAGPAADPAVVKSGSGYYGYTTGRLAPMRHSPSAKGPWAPVGGALSSTGSWSTGAGIWAPDVHQVSGEHWVMYYSGLVEGIAPNQRCIGVAESFTGPAGPFDPVETPLSCPSQATRPDGSPVNASDQPITPSGDAGLIDASAFQTSDGRRFVLYKTQRPNPITALRIVEVDETWTRKLPGTESVEVRRHTGQIENPVMVERDGTFYLFSSQNSWTNCTYATVYWTSDRPDGGFAEGETHSLMTSENTGVCGPGGMDIVQLGEGGGYRVFLHGWTCDAEFKVACTEEEARDKTTDYFRRALYGAVLVFTGDGPKVPTFLTPRT